VAWTQTTNELYIPWVREWVKNAADVEWEIPFHQAHGHCSAVWWNRNSVDGGWNIVKAMRYEGVEPVLEVNWDDRLSVAYLADKKFHSVDQSLGKDPWFDLKPLVLEGDIVL
jgi:hypothetical protein